MAGLPGSTNPNWRGGPVEKTCEHCGARFVVPPSRALTARCCTLACWNAIQDQNRLRPRRPAPTRPRLPDTVEDRFLRHFVAEGSGCWLWTGRLSDDGYGVMWLHRQFWLAHRYSYTYHRGPIPAGLCVLHSCDAPACVNPAHFFIGTQLDNISDMIAKGRLVPPAAASGHRNPSAKLTAEQVASIRSRYVPRKVTLAQLAAECGVCESTVYDVVKRLTYRDEGK
jgi:hypothetical protein